MRKQRFQPPRGPRHKPLKPRAIAPSIQALDELLQMGGITLNRDQLDRLWTYHNLIRKRNQDRDLTRIIDFEQTVLKHYIDSMIVGKFYTLPSPIVDIGTGAGFPGIPLKIRYPHLKFTLAEPRPRRVEFLKEAISTLELKHTKVFDHRVVSASFKEQMAAVITRALEPIEKTILRTSACLPAGGVFIFLKGPAVDPEIKSALRRFDGKIELVLDKKYKLPNSPHERRLVVMKRLVTEVLTSHEPETASDVDEEASHEHME